MEITKIELHEWQRQAWYSKKRFILFCAGVQSGKTTFGVIWILNESQKHGEGDYLIVAPTYRILNQSTLQKFKEMVPKGWGVFNKSDSTYTTIDGKTFFLRSADKPESIEGITAKAIWADEASLMKANIWLMMQGRVSKTLGRILCTFTPISLNWVHREIEKDKERVKKGQDSQIDFIQFRSVDSPYFPKEEFERARQMLSPIQFQLRYEGIFGKAEGLIYQEFSKHNTVNDFAIPREWRKIGGIDWGFMNPFVALEGAISPDGILFIYKERYQSRCTLKEHAQNLNFGITYYADPSSPQEIEELRALGLDVMPANNDVPTGINAVTARIKNRVAGDDRTIGLKIFKSCINTIDEFALYQWEKNQSTGEWKDKPLKKDDHCMDALRYLIMGLGIPKSDIFVLGGDEEEFVPFSEQIEKEKEPEADIETFHTPEHCRQYLELSKEQKNVAEIARIMKVNEGLLRRWLTEKREVISATAAGGRGSEEDMFEL